MRCEHTAAPDSQRKPRQTRLWYTAAPALVQRVGGGEPALGMRESELALRVPSTAQEDRPGSSEERGDLVSCGIHHCVGHLGNSSLDPSGLLSPLLLK